MCTFESNSEAVLDGSDVVQGGRGASGSNGERTKGNVCLYDSTYLLYSKNWHNIDLVSAYLVNGKMREMCPPQMKSSLMFDAVSEDLVRLFNDTVFVVGMTHVQAQETIDTQPSGYSAADTERDRTGG